MLTGAIIGGRDIHQERDAGAVAGRSCQKWQENVRRDMMRDNSFLSLLLSFFLFAGASFAVVVGLTAPFDVAALAAIKSAIAPSSIPPYSCIATWDFSAAADPCALPRRTHFICGLTCEFSSSAAAHSRVTAITLDPAGYCGVLSPAVANLTHLTHLELTDNSFHGPIPASLSSLSSLQTLSLATNSFSGKIPPSLGHLTALESLDLSRNALTGEIPQSLSSLAGLRTLDLSYNRISGRIPPALPPNMVELALRGNALMGPLLRSSFAGLRYLEVAELAANRIGGKLEGWFIRLPALQQVDLANNTLTSVAIGKEDFAAAALVTLDLGFNQIEGLVPVELVGFPALTSLTLRHNLLKGGIPWEYAGAKQGSPFRRLFLDGNFLNGKVPSAFFAGAEQVTGSFGDNCLENCPATEALCVPSQKPADVCRQVYGVQITSEEWSLNQPKYLLKNLILPVAKPSDQYLLG